MKTIKAIVDSGLLSTALVLLCGLHLGLAGFSPKVSERDVLIDIGFLLIAIYAGIGVKK